VNYNLDVFGGARRAVQSAEARAEISGFQLEGAYLNLTANIVTTAIREAALRAQYESNLEIYEAQKNLADIIAKQLEIGTASRVDLTSQVSLAASSQIDLLNLNKNLSFTRNQLSVLVGEFPGNGLLAKFDLNKLNLPEKIPLSVPSDLVRQRPDIRAAEAYIKSTNALVGVATANLLPQITLSGATGSQALTTGALFGPNAAIWSVAGGVFQPLFQGGALLAQRRGAIATNEAAVFQYQATVLSAFQEVANALQALESDALALRAASEAERNALEYLNLLQQQYKLGTGSYLAVLIAQRQYQQTKFRLIDAQANRFANTAALFVALGGGWWNRTGPAYQAQKKEDLHNQGSSQQEMRQ
jgi:NodT family efflux transporter outer membrane factor (OMF) lipoprotein